MNKKIISLVVLAGVAILFAGLWIGSELSKPSSFGGLVHNTQEIFRAGIKAGTSGTEVINSSGTYVGAISGTTGAFSGAVSGTTGAFSSTLGVTGAITATGGILLGGSAQVASSTSKLICNTGTVNFGAMTAGGYATSSMTVTGAAVGNICKASLTTSTSTADALLIGCVVNAANTAYITVHSSNTTLDLDSGTARACIEQY